MSIVMALMIFLEPFFPLKLYSHVKICVSIIRLKRARIQQMNMSLQKDLKKKKKKRSKSLIEA